VYEKPAQERAEVRLFIDWMKNAFGNGQP